MASLQSHSELASKIRGCMIGSLIGDCLGKPFEQDPFFAPVDKQALKNLFTDVLSDDSKQLYKYTDDTAMTISIAKSLVENKKIDSTDMAKRFATVYFKEPWRNYGFHVRAVFKALKDSDFQDVFLPAKLQFNGSGSYGNGAAMRIAPIALFTHDKTEDFIQEAVKECSFVTHTHPNGYNGAILQCFAIQAALHLDSSQELNPVEFINELEIKMKQVETKEDTPYCNILKKMKKIYLKKLEKMTSEEIADYLGNDVTALGSVPSAIYSFLKGLQPLSEFESSNPFIRTIYFAISIGGDTDTIATMAGGIAGAYHGDQVIPKTVQMKCEKMNEVIALADELVN